MVNPFQIKLRKRYGTTVQACRSRPSSHKRGSSVTTVLQKRVFAPTRRYGQLAHAPNRGRGLGEGDPGGGAGGLGEEDFWTSALRYVLQHWDSGSFLSSIIVKEEDGLLHPALPEGS